MYYPIFKNIGNVLEELHILLAPDEQHKKVFTDIPVVYVIEATKIISNLFIFFLRKNCKLTKTLRNKNQLIKQKLSEQKTTRQQFFARTNF